MSDAIALVKATTTDQLALLAVAPDTAPPDKRRKRGKVPKRKGGHPPHDYTAVELYLDLKHELNKRYPSPEKVLPMYMALRRLINW